MFLFYYLFSGWGGGLKKALLGSGGLKKALLGTSLANDYFARNRMFASRHLSLSFG